MSRFVVGYRNTDEANVFGNRHAAEVFITGLIEGGEDEDNIIVYTAEPTEVNISVIRTVQVNIK